MRRKYLIIYLTLSLMNFNSQAQENHAPSPASQSLTGLYLGQEAPGDTPVIFAKGIISTALHEHSFPSFSGDLKQVLWTSKFIDNYAYEFPTRIIETNCYPGNWSEPDFLDIVPLQNSCEAFFSPCNDRIYFMSSTEQGEWGSGMGKHDIWFIERKGATWGAPVNPGYPLNTENTESCPSVTDKLTLYYVGYAEGVKNNYGIYRCQLRGGTYADPELLPGNINSEYLDWTPFIAPDESYLMFSSFRPGGYGNGDLYISFKTANNEWSDPVNLGEAINGPGNERYPYVSPDGKYLFFVSDIVDNSLLEDQVQTFSGYREKINSCGNGWGDIYWVDLNSIEVMKER